MKKILSIILVIAIIMTSAVSVFAVSNSNSDEQITNEYPGTVVKYIGYACLSIITLGWYALSKINHSAKDINYILQDEKILTGWKLFVLNYVTCGIYDIIWTAKYKSILNEELSKRGIDYKITWWLLFSDYKLFKATNLLIKDYNAGLLAE